MQEGCITTNHMWSGKRQLRLLIYEGDVKDLRADAVDWAY